MLAWIAQLWNGQDWSQFASNVVSGAITGGVIGLILARADHTRRGREAVERATRDWRRLRPQLAPLFVGEPRDRATVVAQMGVPQLRETLAPFELEDWDALVSDPVLHALADLEAVQPVLNQHGQQLMAAIEAAVRSVVPAHLHPDARYAPWWNRLAFIVTGRLYGEPLTVWEEMLIKEMVEGNIEAMEARTVLGSVVALAERPALAAPLNRYRASALRWITDYNTIRDAVIERPLSAAED